ncbi:MAG: TldD/PmbA family protein [Elusimicrobia bacterium]|nr:TldD/PmbA family protein [Elusimicrobiota bacterium]
MESLQELAREGLDWIKDRPQKGLEAELYLSRAEERGLERREGRPDGVSQASLEGAGLRVAAGGRMGFACAAGLSLETIKGLYAKALAQMAHLEADSAKAFAGPKASEPDEALAQSLWDQSLFADDWDKILPRLEAMEASARSADRRISSILRAGYGESRGEVVTANTLGLSTWERGGSASVGLSALCAADDERQTGSSFRSARRKAELDFSSVAREAAERTVALLGARKLPTGRRSVIFDPWVSGELLDLVAGLLCADQVQRGKSLLAGKLGKRVGSELVTFIDDPRRAGGLASSLYDDEGCPTAKKVMVEGGVVRDYFYDVYTANREGRASNASAGRGSYKGLPSPGCSNFYLAAGGLTRGDLLAGTKDGILVLDIMGMHMADPISGEFSVGVSGLAVKDGALSHPVKSAMISGNLVELLGRIDAVADDLTFYGSLGAPTFRVSQMTVA